ncbi:MAG: PEP-CTERM sorting domain-containing protein [Akkermansiaceae bacterium]|nr:PEP-CTERM sorting domain-containing protein [Akkermansiaceae bacterium]
MKVSIRLFGLAASTALAFVGSSQAATVLSITEVYAHNEYSNFTQGEDDMINGSGINGTAESGDPSWPSGQGDPSTWTATSNAYQTEWQSGNQLDSGTSINSKIGWAVFDLGASTANLENLYIWHIRENSGRVAATYNVYVGTTSVSGLTHGPDNTSSSVDYDFSSAGWSLVTSGTGTYRDTSTISLGNATGRYIGIEILTSGGDTSRVGFSEVAVTQIPEPSVALLSGLGVLMLLRRRKR